MATAVRPLQPLSPAHSSDIWKQIAAPVDPTAIAWRQDGRPTTRDGKFFARFVCYIEANTVRERLDTVVPGEWDLTLEVLKELMNEAGETVDHDARVAIKARLQILGVIREDIGVGKDYKQASTDAFKRVAVRFGIGHELYDYGQNWVQVDGDGKYAKPVEDPAVAYARRHGGAAPANAGGQVAARPTQGAETRGDSAAPTTASSTTTKATTTEPVPNCPKCGGPMWDNRTTKTKPTQPDFKCKAAPKTRGGPGCEGVI